MNVELAELLIAETRKSLAKLLAAEENFYAQNNEDDVNVLPTSDPEYMKAEHEVKLFVKQLEDLTGVSFELKGADFLTASMATLNIEPKLQAIERVAAVLTPHPDVPERSSHQ